MQQFFNVKIFKLHYILRGKLLTKRAEKVQTKRKYIPWNIEEKADKLNLWTMTFASFSTSSFFIACRPRPNFSLFFPVFVTTWRGSGRERGEVSRSRYRQIISSSNFTLVYFLSLCIKSARTFWFVGCCSRFGACRLPTVVYQHNENCMGDG